MTSLILLTTGAALSSAESPARAPDRPRFREIRVSTGVRLHYAQQGDPAGRPVILLHGWSDSWHSFSLVLPRLSERHHVYALDLRGHGGSDRPASGYAMADMAADVLAFLDAKGIGAAVVVGHSMGSLVAQQVALAAPDRVTGLVLVGSGPTGRNEVIPGLEPDVSALADPVDEAFVREFQASTVHAPVPADFMEEVIRVSRGMPARVWRAVLAGMLDAPRFEGVSARRLPALIIWGERDAIFSRSEQDGLLAALPGAVLRVYRETGHAPHWERPARFADDLELFFGDLDGGQR